MVVMTAKLSKGKLITILLIVVVIVALLAALCSAAKKDSAENAAAVVQSNDDRVDYLRSLGWKVDPDPVETQEVRVPDTLPEVLARYNELQRSQGYDLSRYSGKTLKRYVYEIENYPDTTDSYYATLLIYQDQVVGGDVSSGAQGGLMQGLSYPQNT